jgi:undecaprenyl phosphate N,N'-diacetylbacillosamine 1-phosphate transferase
MNKSFYRTYFKRFFDFNLSLLAIIFLSPFLLIIILFQLLFNGRPIFFVQKRVGRFERIFYLLKFRTMNNKKDTFNKLLPDYKRISWFGLLLRKTSIDELPSLINVLKGDMAIIGPRPLLVEYLPLYNENQRRRHLVRPGLSGLAQINGRNRLSWQQKFNFDILYVNNVSLFFDLKIILLTVIKIVSFNNKDVDNSSTVTMEKFNGNL